MKRWRTRVLGLCPRGFHRFIVTIKRETAKAYIALTSDGVYCLPKSQCEVGIEPTGNRYVIDIPDWLVARRKMIKPKPASKAQHGKPR
jgi:hypothetical protein